MAQDRADSPEAIYEALTSDSSFMSCVGEYKFKGKTEPVDSIVILTPGADLPQLESQTGLEVVIHDVGQVERFDYLTEPTESLITWQVVLILWPGSTGQQMTQAAKIIVEKFAGSSTIQTISTPNELGAMIQTVALIPRNATILT